VKDGGVAVEEYLGAGHAEDLACSKNEMSTSLSEALEKIYETSAKIIALQRQSQLGKANPIDAIDANGSREVKSRRRGLLRKSNERRRSAVVCDAYHKDECNSTEAFQWA
jgi:hypothetical protein